MTKRILKILMGLAAGAMLLAGSMTAIAAPKTLYAGSVTKMDQNYYTTKLGLGGDPSLTIAKYEYSGNSADESKPIKGVEFKYAKVGDLYQIVDGRDISMAYGVTSAFATAAGITDTADYTDGAAYYYKNPNTINTALQNLTKDTQGIAGFLLGNNGIGTGTTGDSGTVSVTLDSTLGYGLYLIVENNTSNATDKDGNPLSLTNTQSPFVAALPDSTGNGWNETVTAKVKNSTGSADVEKKIVLGTDSPTGDTGVGDTDITSIGDTVRFRLKAEVPAIPVIQNGNQEKINTFVLTDNLSAGLTPDMNSVTAMTSDTMITFANGDYTVATANYSVSESADGYQPEYAGGTTITITFNESGKAKLDQLATKEGLTAREVYFFYNAAVNDKAVVGPNNTAGNPNEVKLKYQIGTSKEIETGWDKVTEYTFGIQATKQLAGEALSGDSANSIKFALYQLNGTDKKYFTVTKDSSVNAGGVYTAQTNSLVDETNSTNGTEMSPSTDQGTLLVKGLAAGTYYLEETATIQGYNILKNPVEIVIEVKDSDKGTNSYVGADGQYLGTFENDKGNNGTFELMVNNTKGFQLPATGGAGIWMFVLAGVIVIAAGCVYYRAARKKKYAE